MEVYKAINAVMAQLAKDGISKDRKNDQQGYKFRGIDDVYNALSSVLSANALVMLPRVIEREQVERVTAKGGAIFYTTLKMEFDLVCSKDGSKHTIVTYGEAMDSGDKSSNKAMSAAFKYAAMQAFCIPTEGDNDADSTTHEVRPKPIDIKPNSGVAESLTTEERHNMESIASEVITRCTANDFEGAANYLRSMEFEPEQKTFMWGLIPSHHRTKLTKLLKA